MGEKVERAAAPAPVRRRIIERPRLLRLLDESRSRIVMLVAPAGYGKTTLAQQWLARRPHVWYATTEASADVAALAAGLTVVAADITGADVAGVERHLGRSADPEAEVEVISALAADAFCGWPQDAWLAIDDYHALAASPAAEAMVDALSSATGINLMIVTRTRPAWATARRLMYGEVFELGRHDLAMDANEANAVLDDPARSGSGLVALAEGWPAVIGLASLAGDAPSPEESVAGALYDFFAEEVLRLVEPDVRERLSQLATAPVITTALTECVLGRDALAVLGAASNVGLINRTESEWLIHPLLRQFLLTKFQELPAETRDATLARVFAFLLSRRDWDEAFALIDAFDLSEYIEQLIGASLSEMLSRGRVPTLKRWLRRARSTHRSGPATAVLEAEIAFRQGLHGLAEAVATQAAAELPREHALRQRALLRAGQAAYFAERYEGALTHLEESLAYEEDEVLAREARWVAFIAALDAERQDALEFLDRFDDIRVKDTNGSVRMATARLLVATRRGGITATLSNEGRMAHLVRRASDPMIRSAFWNVYAWALALGAQYKGAAGVVEEERREAEASHLSFVLPHANLVGALCAVGLREFADAEAYLLEVTNVARAHDDAFLRLSASAVRAKLAIARGAVRDAVTATTLPTTSRGSARSSWLECLSIRALALAAIGDLAESRAAVEQLMTATMHSQIRALAALARAVCCVAEDEADADAAVEEALRLVRELGQYDCLVTAYRAFPPLLNSVAKSSLRDVVEEIALHANDAALAHRYGLFKGPSAERVSTLSPREEQVLALAAEGRTNDEIASVLFISSVTVKTHLRHIYEKLGVRNRVEAASVVRARQPVR
jgi:LuxR family maltose regulon positive regulatory protein